MPSTRFTKALKSETRERILKDAFKNRQAEIKRTEQDLARRVIEHIIGPDAFERIKQVPEGWLPHATSIHVRTSNSYNSSLYLSLGECVAIPALVIHRGTVLVTDPTLAEELDALHSKVYDREDVELLKTQVAAVLDSFRTVEQFAEGWPEGYKHFPHERLAQTVNGLPAPRIKDLDERIKVIKGET